ncbi:hypothetical protein HanHA300_Chr04g0155761 [Helianthus annuus]|nr:hypothetical protein HanHA300_Chr04g0155761 [Helianthus annuus]KAJ0591105.1 hypothetical protein HanIR_Chr04g0204681 [Helianthus annuus]
METRADEPRRFTNSKTLFYSLFIFIVVFAYSLSHPFRFQSLGSIFTNFLDIIDKNYIFLLCNCILFFLFLDSSGTNQVECDKISVVSVHEYDHNHSLNLHVYNEHEAETEVKQSAILVRVDDEHEMVANVVVEEVEHDDQEEFQQKCEEFIKKVRQSLHQEGRYPMIEYQEFVG